MTARELFDWDPYASDAPANPATVYDDLRRRCPHARSEALNRSLFRHADVMRALTDYTTFSNAVSAHVSVPNGMDPPEHTAYRRILEPYFSSERMAALEPKCRKAARDLLGGRHGRVEFMQEIANEYALQVQCAFLNWSVESHQPLKHWVRQNHESIRSRNRAAMSKVAEEFETHVRAVIAARRSGTQQATDVLSELLQERVHGRLLTDGELVSVLRNWTVGELATLSASAGILAHYLAARPGLQRQLRNDFAELPAAIDEILRIDTPLQTSRRVTTHETKLSGCPLDSGERVTIMWASANRDEEVFGNPDDFRTDRNPGLNLLYGAGIHVCPGAPLARLQLRVLMEELLSVVDDIALPIDQTPLRARFPASGFAVLPLRFTTGNQVP